MKPISESEYFDIHKSEIAAAHDAELRAFVASGADFAELTVFEDISDCYEKIHYERAAYQNAASRLWRTEKIFDCRRMTFSVRQGRIFVRIDKKKGLI